MVYRVCFTGSLGTPYIRLKWYGVYLNIHTARSVTLLRLWNNNPILETVPEPTLYGVSQLIYIIGVWYTVTSLCQIEYLKNSPCCYDMSSSMTYTCLRVWYTCYVERMDAQWKNNGELLEHRLYTGFSSMSPLSLHAICGNFVGEQLGGCLFSLYYTWYTVRSRVGLYPRNLMFYPLKWKTLYS